MSKMDEFSASIFSEIAGTLEHLGCRHPGSDHESTPPMMYREWILCVVGKRADEIENLRSALRLLLRSAVPVTADPVEFRVELEPVNDRPVLFYKIETEAWEKWMAMPEVKAAVEGS